MKFGYMNLNNSILAAENEASHMVNCRIDRGYLEYYDYAVDEDVPVPNRILYLPNGKEVKIINVTGDWTNTGLVKWRKKGSTDSWARPGITLAVAGSPTIAIGTEAAPEDFFLPTAPGAYFYAITVKNKTTGEESSPVLRTITLTQADVDASKVLVVTFAPIVAFQSAEFEFRVYRMPFGGNEYTFSFAQTANITVAASVTDPTKDELLGSLCATLTITDKPFDLAANSITLFSDKLFIGGKATNDVGKEFGILYFSRTSAWTDFPAANFFSFPDEVVGLTKFNEYLAIQTSKALFVLYGNDETDFLLKEIDYKFDGILKNTGQAIGGLSYFLPAAEPASAQGVFAFSNNTVTEISQKVSSLFPADVTAKNWAIDNRFYLVEIFDAGIRLVFDTLLGGFCFNETSTDGFIYQTKDFDVRSLGVSFLKQLYVRGFGNFTVEVIADGETITTETASSIDLTSVFFYVKPTRFETFAIKFTGAEDAVIMDWGVVE